jgi:hypothetical protein
MTTDDKRGSTDAQPTDGRQFAAPDLPELSAGAVARLRALRDQWIAHGQTADVLFRIHEAAYDGANAYAFLKERRIWRTCADELGAALDALLIATRPPETP